MTQWKGDWKCAAIVHGDQCVWMTTSLLLMLVLLADSCLDLILKVETLFYISVWLTYSVYPLFLVMQTYINIRQLHVPHFPVCCSTYY